MNAELHDQIFAYTSHLPHVAAYALLNTLKGLDQDDLAIFSGGGLGEFLRLVSSSPEMWTDIFSMNEEYINCNRRINSKSQFVKGSDYK